MNKIESAPQVSSLQDLKEEMKSGDIVFQGRIRSLEAGLQPYLMSGLMQLGQKASIMHAAMVGAKDKILDYGTGGVNYLGGNVVRGLREISLKDVEAGKRLIAIGRVKGADGKENAKRFVEIAKKKTFDASKSMKVGINRLIGKNLFDIKPQGDFCSTIVDKATPEIHINGPARPVDLLNQKKVEIVAVYDPMEKKAEFAPGLPSKDRYDIIQNNPGTSRLVIQRHGASQDHYDMRLQQGDVAHSWVIRKLPSETDKLLAIRQPTHTAEYMGFEGKIEKGYGAGTVSKAYDKPVDVIQSDEKKVKIVLPEGEFTMIHLKDKNWLMVKNKNTIPNPVTTKPSYKDASNKELDFNDPNKVLQPKVDGGHTIFRLNSDGPNRFYSYRTSKKDNRPIEHTHQSPIIRDAVVPAELNGVEIRGEIYAKDKSGKAIPAEEVGGILNSGIENSRELQAKKGRLIPYMFKVVKWKDGKNVENSTYREQLDMLKEISSKVPEFRMPEIAATPNQKKELFNQIKSKMHPDTSEGVIEWNLDAPGGDPKKVKLRDSHEVVIRNIFPAESKTGRKFAGGFEYSWQPESKIVGRVGTGFSQKMREDMLKNPQAYLNRVARIKTQQVFSSGAARAPSFYGLHVEKNL